METRERDIERLMPIQAIKIRDNNNTGFSNSSSESVSPLVSSSHHSAGREAFCKVIRSWASKKFMTGCVILLYIAINEFDLGFVISITFIFLIGVFMSSWLGASVLNLGEWFIKKMPFIGYIYSASRQISAAVSPDQNSNAFKDVAAIRHPRNGEYAFGFITSSVILSGGLGTEELCSIYVPTNHLYLGDVFLIGSTDILRPNLSVREGIDESFSTK